MSIKNLYVSNYIIHRTPCNSNQRANQCVKNESNVAIHIFLHISRVVNNFFSRISRCNCKNPRNCKSLPRNIASKCNRGHLRCAVWKLSAQLPDVFLLPVIRSRYIRYSRSTIFNGKSTTGIMVDCASTVQRVVFRCTRSTRDFTLRERSRDCKMARGRDFISGDRAMPASLGGRRFAFKFYEYGWMREWQTLTERKRAARNGEIHGGRLMAAREASCPAVDCQIIDNIPKPTRSCAGTGISVSMPVLDARESDANRRAKPQARQIITRRWRDPQQRNTKHDAVDTRVFVLAYLRPSFHWASARTPAHVASRVGWRHPKELYQSVILY